MRNRGGIPCPSEAIYFVVGSGVFFRAGSETYKQPAVATKVAAAVAVFGDSGILLRLIRGKLAAYSQLGDIHGSFDLRR